MCDYSLQAIASRPAAVGDKLVVVNFGTCTVGFAPQGSGEPVAVCVLPGTEIAFDGEINVHGATGDIATGSSVAIFRQINIDNPNTHHDAIELPDGRRFLLTLLAEYQTATVLQTPAAPKTAQEAQAQKRIAYAG